MPNLNKSSNSDKSQSNGNRAATTGKSANIKKQGPVNIKATSAREKAKNFDEGRRSDANSNEL